MEYVKMTEDLSFSRIVLGFWRVGEWGLSSNQLADYLAECIDLGITTMDHADIYGIDGDAETIFGEALEKRPELRNKMQIVSKCGIVYKSDTARVKYYDYTKEHILGQVDESLRKMHIDHLDTLLLHRPSPYMNPEEISAAFDELLKAGKVRSFGVSNFLPQQYRMLKSYLNVPLVTDQVELSALAMENMDNGVIDLCLEERIHPMLWSPLAGGRIFTDKGEKAQELRDVLEVVRAEQGAEDIGEIAFAWLLSHPVGALPITGSGEIKLARTPVNALQYKLTNEQWFMIWTAVRGHKVP